MRRAALCQSFSGGGSGLLDIYPDASVGYSLRNLKDSQSGNPVIRIRRASDNIEQDFIAEEITDGTLATFCSGTDGLVATWYDQSSNSNHAFNTTALNQPKLVSNGVVSTSGGKPAVFCVNSQSLNATTVLGGTATASVYFVGKGGGYGAYYAISGVSSGTYGLYVGSEGITTYKINVAVVGSGAIYPRLSLVVGSNIITPSTLYWAAQSGTVTKSNTLGSWGRLFSNMGTNSANTVVLTEVIMYQGIDQTSNDVDIRTELEAYY